MKILNHEIANYLLNLIPERNPTLKEMEEYANINNFPIIGPLVGQFLLQYSLMLKPKRILELGSGYGYSAMWFSSGTPESTQIICTDGSEKNAEKAKYYFMKAEMENRIEFHIGDAVETMDNLEGNFDFIFCDIDKEGYPEAFSKAVPRLNSGGIMITDNSLWSGRVIDDSNIEESTKGVRLFNNQAFTDPRVYSMIIPIRDGVCISYKY
ncbi:MAG: putative O-methyltransferase [Candidatus Heimdallarchaeota archaeon LC_3]|nr:MAG: putative O-methyltransferase [Candidatus Heimdallarchaeota archaeon LC_3]